MIEITNDRRPELKRYAISARAASEPTWPIEDQRAILRAQKEFDAGTIIMCQGRQNGTNILYAIPRLTPIAPTTFFADFHAFMRRKTNRDTHNNRARYRKDARIMEAVAAAVA